MITGQLAAAEEQTDTPGVRLVTFVIGGEVHALDVHWVEEVVEDHAIYPLPDMPPHVLGVLPWRGALIPVIDPALALGLQRRTTGIPAVLILEGEGRRLGMAADQVSEVVRVPADRIGSLPGGQERLVAGLARIGTVLVTLINPGEFFGAGAHLSVEETP